MAGMDRNTGKPLDGWAHVAQSIADLFTTPKGSRVMRRAFGASLPRLVDAPMSPATLIDFFAGAAKAIADFEPRFQVTQMRVADAAAGRLTVDCEGIYFPRGHLGDFSVRVPQKASISL
jgi:phage baseplate assembly protein W